MAIDFSDPSLDYSAAEQELLRQQEAIKAIRNFKLLDSGAQPQAFQSAVTGTTIAAPIVKRPLLSSLSPLIADTTAGREERDLMGQKAALNRAQDVGFQQRLAQLNAPPQEMAGPPDPVTGEAPTRGRTPEERLAIASSLSRFPRYKEQAGAIFKQELERPETERKAAFERTKQQNLQAHQKVMELQGQARIDAEAGKPFPVPGVGLFQKTGVGADGLPSYKLVQGSTPPEGVTVKEINGRNVGLDKAGNVVMDYGPVTKPPDKLPVDIGQKYLTNEASSKQIDKAIATLSSPQGKDATGMFTYARKLPFGDKVVDAFNPEGRPTRALIQAISSTRIHGLTGSAQTVAEVDRLKPFIPQETDTYEQAMDKLKLLAEEIKTTQGEIIQYATSQGYKLPNQANPTPEMPAVKGSRVAPYPEGSTPPAAAAVSAPAPAPAKAPEAKPYEAPQFKPEQRASFGVDLMKEWKSASPTQRVMIEQRALSVGATYNGREYLGGPFNEKSSWK